MNKRQTPSGPRSPRPRTALEFSEGGSSPAAHNTILMNPTWPDSTRPGPARPDLSQPAHRSLDHSTSGTCCSVATAAAAATATNDRGSHRTGSRRVPIRIRDTTVAAIIPSAFSAWASEAAADQMTVTSTRAPPPSIWAGPSPILCCDWSKIVALMTTPSHWLVVRVSSHARSK